MSENGSVSVLPEGEPLWVNEWEQALTLIIGGGLLFLGVVYFFIAPGRHSHTPSLLGIGTALVCIGCGAGIALGSRASVIVKRDGIVVQGLVRCRHLGWHEVREFKIVPSMYRPWLMIVLVDGGRIRVPGFKARSINQRELVKERVAELNHRAADAH